MPNSPWDLAAPGAHQPRDPAVLGAWQHQVCNSPRVWLSWWSSCPSHLAALCVQQSRVYNSPWTSLLRPRDPQDPSGTCSGRAVGVPEQGQMGFRAATG